MASVVGARVVLLFAGFLLRTGADRRTGPVALGVPELVRSLGSSTAPVRPYAQDPERNGPSAAGPLSRSSRLTRGWPTSPLQCRGGSRDLRSERLGSRPVGELTLSSGLDATRGAGIPDPRPRSRVPHASPEVMMV